jgi:Ca-activated chloride channel family protein
MTTTPHDNDPRKQLGNTPELSADQQVLLTTAALEQLEAGSDDAATAELLLTGPHGPEALGLIDNTRQLVAAAQAAAADDIASLADDPVRADRRRAVLAAIAAQGQAMASPTSHQSTASNQKEPAAQRQPGRRWAFWLATLGSLAAAVLVMVSISIPQWQAATSPEIPDTAGLRQSPPRLAEKESAAVVADAPMESLGRSADKQSLSTAKAKSLAPIGALAAAPQAAPPAEKLRFSGRSAGIGGGMPATQQDGQLQANARQSESAKRERNMPAPTAPTTALADAGRPSEMRRLAIAVDEELVTDFADRSLDDDRLAERRGLRQKKSAGEGYAAIVENPLRDPLAEPLSTFSVDVDTASYANVRRFLTSGRRPPRNAVRIEELINYFSYDDAAPTGDDPFAVSLEAAASPWHADRLVVRIGLKARDIDRRERPAGNLVFLVDVSGSMSAANKLPLVKQSLKLLVNELGASDRISLVTYAGQAALRLPPTSGDEKATILAAIDGLASGGSTHGSAGIEMAYAQAAEHFVEGGVNRVLLATDGDLNVGITSDAALEALIREKAKGGVFLTVLGFGEGNLQDAKMERIADKGNGLYAYIDGLREARKVLVEQLTGSTITVAKDVKLQVEFNPATVAGYRLIGYENRLLAAEDFRDDTKDAGEIGAGHSVTALYEIVPRGVAPGLGAEPLKYQQQPEPPVVLADETGEPSDDLLTVKLRWKQPEGSTSQLAEFPLADRGGAFEAASTDLRFAAAVASFGLLLRGSEQAGSVTFSKAAQIAAEALGADPGGYRTEFVDLVRTASGR